MRKAVKERRRGLRGKQKMYEYFCDWNVLPLAKIRHFYFVEVDGKGLHLSAQHIDLTHKIHMAFDSTIIQIHTYQALSFAAVFLFGKCQPLATLSPTPFMFVNVYAQCTHSSAQLNAVHTKDISYIRQATLLIIRAMIIIIIIIFIAIFIIENVRASRWGANRRKMVWFRV